MIGEAAAKTDSSIVSVSASQGDDTLTVKEAVADEHPAVAVIEMV